MSDIGNDVLGTSINTTNGAISAQIGDSVNREVTCDNAEWIQHVGFASRPASAEPGKSSCQVLSIERTDRDICYASRDLRGTKLYGSLGAGETCIYANGPRATGTSIISLKDDGTDATIALEVRQGNSSSGNPIRVTVKSTGEVKIVAGSCQVTINGQTGDITIDGSSVNLGGVGGAPVVVDAGTLMTWITAVATGLNGIGIVNTPPVGITSTKVKAI